MREFDPCCLAEYLGDVDYFKCELAMEEDDEGEYDDDADNAEAEYKPESVSHVQRGDSDHTDGLAIQLRESSLAQPRRGDQ
jgi:hypothetical protein